MCIRDRYFRRQNIGKLESLSPFCDNCVYLKKDCCNFFYLREEPSPSNHTLLHPPVSPPHDSLLWLLLSILSPPSTTTSATTTTTLPSLVPCQTSCPPSHLPHAFWVFGYEALAFCSSSFKKVLYIQKWKFYRKMINLLASGWLYFMFTVKFVESFKSTHTSISPFTFIFKVKLKFSL